jgi:hypothetical protein
MWYIEDLLRVNEFDAARIREDVIQRFDRPGEILQQMDDWYRELIYRMEIEGIKETGHLDFLTEQVHRLNDFHLNMINDLNEPQYRQAYFAAQPLISELKRKSPPGTTEIEACLNALYLAMMMRMKGKALSDETAEALEIFGNMLALLNVAYMKQRP